MNVVAINKNKTMRAVASIFLMAASIQASAMDPLSEYELSDVTGKDGVTIGLNVPQDGQITADQIKWTIDPGNEDLANNSLENSILLGKDGATPEDNFLIKPINMNGANADHNLEIALAIDAYTNDEGRPGIGVDARWNRMRMQIGNLSVTDSEKSFGAMALDSAGRFAVFGDGGFANTATDSARVIVNVGNVQANGLPSDWTIDDPGQLFYRMGSPGSTEIQLTNLGFLFDMHKGTAGFDSNGLVVSAAENARTDLNLTFDIYANEFNSAGDAFTFVPGGPSIPMLFFGWRGGMDDFDLHLRPEGVWLSDGSPTAGLTASLGFNLNSDFQFVVGEAKPEATGDKEKSYLEFTDPVSLPTSLGQDRKDVEFGHLTLDAISSGQGAAPICFGGSNPFGAPAGSCASSTDNILPLETINLPASDTGLALLARDWGLHAYSSSVVYRDGGDSDLGIDEGWALIYTLGEISSNIYLYPQTGPGFTMDLAMAIQTIGGADALGRPDRSRWENGTHLMIGDTDKNFAIGLVGSDLLLAADDVNVGLSLADGLNLSSNQVRLQLRGMFGGGDIPNMNTPVYASYIDANLEFDDFVFNLLPDLSGERIYFAGKFSLADLDGSLANSTSGEHSHDDGSYISLAEPNFNKLNVDLRLANITGDIEIPKVLGQGGVIDLLSATSETDDKPKLRIQNNMFIGKSANGGTGDPLTIGSVEFGGRTLGSVVMPSGHIHASITLKQQTP